MNQDGLMIFYVLKFMRVSFGFIKSDKTNLFMKVATTICLKRTRKNQLWNKWGSWTRNINSVWRKLKIIKLHHGTQGGSVHLLSVLYIHQARSQFHLEPLQRPLNHQATISYRMRNFNKGSDNASVHKKVTVIMPIHASAVPPKT